MEELDQVEDEFAEDGLGDAPAGDNFDLERGRRSLASIFDSDEDSVLEVDSAQQDESLLVRPGPVPCTRVAREVLGEAARGWLHCKVQEAVTASSCWR